MIRKKGREFTNPPVLGDYLSKTINGRIILLRGKYKGAYLNTVPTGYVKNFLLKQCYEDMLPEEIKLCETYCTTDETNTVTKKIKRTLKMTKKDKVTVEVNAGRGIADAFDTAAKYGCTEISLTIPTPDRYKKQTVFDKLRTRGTPLELIGSYILADYKEMARQLLEGCILEAVYEHLAEKFNATCVFEKAPNDVRDEISIFSLEDGTSSIPFTKEEKELIQKYKNIAPITLIPLKKQNVTVEDTIQASILNIINDILHTVKTTVQSAIVTYSKQKNALTFSIVPDLSSISMYIPPDNTQIEIFGQVALCATMRLQN
ncbi:MAG: hypothetical protein PVI90_00020 [Desulfobacteraceae bacterium]|jgi:hypothetical protein